MKSISQLGPLEQQVMNIIWRRQTVTVREVLTELEKHRQIAYTTVMTIMSRLVKKGYLSQSKKGKSNIFSIQRNQQQTLQSLVRQTIHSFIDRFGEEAVATFLDEADYLSNTSVHKSTSKKKK